MKFEFPKSSWILAQLILDFDFFFLALVLPATDNAIAMACFGGVPALISVLMFLLIVVWLLPFFIGISWLPKYVELTAPRINYKSWASS
jgi:hypothetical protein